jgi:hypothetical protein
MNAAEEAHKLLDEAIAAERANRRTEEAGGFEWGPGRVDFTNAKPHQFVGDDQGDDFPCCAVCQVPRGSGEATWNGGLCAETATTIWPSGWSAKKAQEARLQRIATLVDLAAQEEPRADSGNLRPDEAVRSCNRHNDCAAAEVAYLSRHPDAALPIPDFHCYDDCCEDCFGK